MQTTEKKHNWLYNFLFTRFTWWKFLIWVVIVGVLRFGITFLVKFLELAGGN